MKSHAVPKQSGIIGNLDGIMDNLDHYSHILNYLVGFSVIGTTVFEGISSGDLSALISTLLIDRPDLMEVAEKMGLFEKLSDAFFHFYATRLNKDSSTMALTAGFAFDAMRIFLAYRYGSTQTNKISNFLVYPDIVLFHPANFVTNGARLLHRALGLFSTSSTSTPAATAAPTPTTADSILMRFLRPGES